MITADCHHDVLHAVKATKVRGTVRYNTTGACSVITLTAREDVPPTIRAIKAAGWVVQNCITDPKTFFVVGAKVNHP